MLLNKDLVKIQKIAMNKIDLFKVRMFYLSFYHNLAEHMNAYVAKSAKLLTDMQI